MKKKYCPAGLMVNFLQGAEVLDITCPLPDFGWIVNSTKSNDTQISYQLLVASKPEKLQQQKADIWDSGKVFSQDSINIPYNGKELHSNYCYYWKVKTWCKKAGESEWSDIQQFSTGRIRSDYTTTRYPLQKTKISPIKITKKKRRHFLIDFGKVAFGYLVLNLSDVPKRTKIIIHLAERGSEKGVNKRPGANIRYHKLEKVLKAGENCLEVHPLKNIRNTHGSAIILPKEFGVITPFRYVEIEKSPVAISKEMVLQIAVHYPFNGNLSSFSSSNRILNNLYDLCKYSMKATSFCGVYVDGDRERIPYEADAYINQLSHYAVDRDFTLARYTHEYLLNHPTWPTEWKHHSVMMAWMDYMYTGNTKSLFENYSVLKAKTMEAYAREDGLLKTDEIPNSRDIVDWPPGERDDYEFTPINTVVNAFYYHTLLQIVEFAKKIGKTSEAEEYKNRAVKVKKIFNEILFDESHGIYIDGEGSIHSSLHANMIPLAFGLVPDQHKKKVVDFVVSKGMACSVYAAQYLLEGLYIGGRPDVALERMISTDIRSWYNMLRVGSTITLEAWDNKFKPNQDWNHAWGSVPGNIIARFLMGIRPLEPGFSKVLVQPQPAFLKNASITIPTIRGPISMYFENIINEKFSIEIEIPTNMVAKVGLPKYNHTSFQVLVDETLMDASELDGYLFVDNIGSGRHIIKLI